MTVYERPNGKWAAQVWDPATRRLRQVGTSRSTGEKGRKEAFKLQAEAATRTAGSGETVRSFRERWLVDFPRPARSTNETHMAQTKVFAQTFGRRRMDSFTVPEAYRWASENRYLLSSVRAMFSDARRAGVVQSNPFVQLGLKGSRGRRDLPSEWLTEPQVLGLIEACAVVGDFEPFMRGLVTVAAYCGIRPGENFALERRDVREQTLLVARAVDSKTRTVRPYPKNGLAREIVLPRVARDAIDVVPRLAETELLFPAPRGGNLWRPSFQWYWKEVRAAAGLPGMAFYELRHFCATWLLEKGLAPADVAVQLGHTDGGALVMSTYGHPSDRAARARITAAVDGNVTGLGELRRAL